MALTAERVLAAPDPVPIAKWSFDSDAPGVAKDDIAGINDKLVGFAEYVPGVKGRALRFDGYSTAITRSAKPAAISDTLGAAEPDRIPRLPSDFSFSTWIAFDAYPWNWLPIVDQDRDEQAGYSFGVDAFGHLGLRLAVDGAWQAVASVARIPLKRWTHVAATFDHDGGMVVYIDGLVVGRLAIKGRFTPANNTDLVIGRVRRAAIPTPSDAIHPLDPVWYSLEGSLDELEVWSGCLSPEAIGRLATAVPGPSRIPLPWAELPSGPKGAGRFGAYACTLPYDSAWDRLRRMGRDTDVVVRFDKSPIRLVFWQGTAYEPAWVTENGKWYTDEFLEAYGPPGCTGGEDCEPMSDKQTRYAHVSILESNDARAVVHWRYALSETRNYSGAFTDPVSGWSDWADEYWTIYPDGVAVREQVLWTSEEADWAHEWQETIIVNGPGQRPEDNIALQALTLANMDGDSFTYSWLPKESTSFDYPRGPVEFPQPKGPNIQMVNLKSVYKPFQIVDPKGTKILPYNGERSYSTFEWWNHWPVAQVPSSGRPALAADRASHTSLSHIYWGAYRKTERNVTKLLLDGLTNKTAAGLVPLARSWLNPPQALVSGGAVDEGYDPAQRAYVSHVPESGGPAPITITVSASEVMPLVNPAFVVRGWAIGASVQINGIRLAEGPSIRIGHRQTLDGSDLVVWIELESKAPTRISIEPK